MLGEVRCTADLVCDKKDCKARVTVVVTPNIYGYYNDRDTYPSVDYEIADMPAGWSYKDEWGRGNKHYCPDHTPYKPKK